jgi:hypothetical protein
MVRSAIVRIVAARWTAWVELEKDRHVSRDVFCNAHNQHPGNIGLADKAGRQFVRVVSALRALRTTLSPTAGALPK